MTKLICKCSVIIKDEDIFFCNGWDDQYGEITEYSIDCENCGVEYHSISLGYVDDIEDLKKVISTNEHLFLR